MDDACLHGRRVERVFSIIVFILICWLYWSTHRLILHPWLIASYGGGGEDAPQRGKIFSYLFVGLFHVICWMTLWSLLVVCNTDPGQVPEGYMANNLRGSAVGLGGTDWCVKCEQARPPRAHHCRHCRRCVLRMDHHCPWIGNCVGYWNHGHFLRFLTYACIACMMAVGATGIRLFRGHLIFEDPALDDLNEMNLIVAIINAAFTLCILIMLLILTVYQWSNAAWNMTTIEHLEWEAANDRAKRRRWPSVIFPYCFDSTVACFKVVLGGRVWAWPFPLPSSWQLKGQGNGLFYTHRPDVPNLVWPPTDLRVDHGDIDDGRQRHLQSEPHLPFSGRGRFRRGSEGYLIPASEIGVHFEANSSEPLLPTHQQDNI